MEIKQVKLVYFSPTGTTQKVLQAMAKGMGVDDVRNINLTLPDGAKQNVEPFADELVILGVPVYGGRVPATAIERLKKLQGNGSLCVPVVLYGNREFEDSLLELKNLAAELGFKPVAGAAFIGEHSFATEALPVANGRPDDQDLKKAREFGAKVMEKVTGLASAADLADPEIPGRFPYEGGPKALDASPITNPEACILCGTCASVCPTSAITVEDSVETKVELCIRCTACVKNCPTGARVWQNEMLGKIATWLSENCAARKEPEFFGVSA
ncbi:MAG: EFR1 family ferrodoxin [Desulfarculaceae bacterium]|nr:EFR1 family ferrodoxin [Desulfarculaceae bacterium]MCF8073650.1 EFR1 family ferrodoxin [Desulfarculaceae bacterium]MCF8103118.1 EFR1 family ferrodoxin [Desulfarculaceae bacterium]MCF8115634.1 EFR1 family ferrodoxin [Desulfarculaceae bacterium]